MWHMRGFKACRLIRDDEAGYVLTIMVTTHGLAATAECTNYVTKPIRAVELLAEVRRHFGERRQ
jgi:DNA-binding response OmpR family regulator